MASNLNSLDPMRFIELSKKREMAISSASERMPASERPSNILAKELHPKEQRMVISKVITNNDYCRTYILHTEDGRRCAYFSAGQYVSVKAAADGRELSRPYSIISSPKDSLKGEYAITVKRVRGGIVSNHIVDNWAEGDIVTVSDPMGNFTYEPLRDGKSIVGIAGGSGITPFISLAKAIADGDEDCDLTIIYGNRRKEDILFKNEFGELERKTDKIKVVYVLSDENTEGFEHGFITAEMIQKHTPQGEYSIFICGPEKMVNFVDRELASLDIERKFIRHEVQGETFAEGHENMPENVNITVNMCGRRYNISGRAEDTILRILEKNSIAPPTGCRSGECGFCRSRLISGEVYIPEGMDMRRMADEKYGYIHPCCTYALTDVEIEVYIA